MAATRRPAERGKFHQLAAPITGEIYRVVTGNTEKQRLFQIGTPPALMMAWTRWSGSKAKCQGDYQ
jgi:hypothetical protein